MENHTELALASSIKKERTLVLLKPDAVSRGLIGEITGRFERAGLKVVGLKMVTPEHQKAAGHYSGSVDWLEGMGKKTLASFEEFSLDVQEIMGTSQPLEIGEMVQEWLVTYLASGPLVALVLEGVHAVKKVRGLIGFTIPSAAAAGTIRGDFAVDSNTVANVERRAAKNLVHASGDDSEAAHEISFWFDENELHSYERVDVGALF